MRLNRQGYIVLAVGPTRYLDMAVNLAASLKVMDPGRPVCLVHDPGATIPPEAACDDERKQTYDDCGYSRAV
jgi:hypothetical protein